MPFTLWQQPRAPARPRPPGIRSSAGLSREHRSCYGIGCRATRAPASVGDRGAHAQAARACVSSCVFPGNLPPESRPRTSVDTVESVTASSSSSSSFPQVNLPRAKAFLGSHRRDGGRACGPGCGRGPRRCRRSTPSPEARPRGAIAASSLPWRGQALDSCFGGRPTRPGPNCQHSYCIQARRPTEGVVVLAASQAQSRAQQQLSSHHDHRSSLEATSTVRRDA